MTHRLERIFIALSAAFTAWILLTSANLARVGWTALPVADDWDRWTNFSRYHYTTFYFFQQHVDHRLVVPKLLFAVDHVLFHGRGWFLLICTFCIQALTAFMLLRLSERAYPQARTDRWILACATLACLFSGQQWFNFFQPFQVQFPMVYCAAIAAFFALWKAHQQAWKGPWVILSIAAAAVGTYSMANGLLLWPMLLLTAFWLRMPRRWMIALGISTILLGPTYLYQFQRAIIPLHLPPSTRPQRLATYLFAQLGAPMEPISMLWKSEGTQLAIAAVPGILIAIAVLGLFVMAWRRRATFGAGRAVLVFFCVFLASTCALIAYGRYEDATINALMSKYLTPPYLLWASLLLAAWPITRHFRRALVYGAICAGIFLGVAIHQSTALASVRNSVPGYRLGEVAIANNVGDAEAWFWFFHTPEVSLEAIDYLRKNSLALFTEEWTHWPGIPLQRRFSIDHTPGACQGKFEDATTVVSTVQPGWRVTGWAWDNRAGRSPRYIILGDEAGLVAGVALPGFPLPPALAPLPEKFVASTWIGYVAGQARPVTAYILEADERSLCPIGTFRLRSSSAEVAFQSLGPLLPVSDPEITAGFAPDGYYKGPGGPGAPPVDGPVYGSAPDANTGSIRFGPFHLDGHTEIAIPLVTGPAAKPPNSIVIRDAGTKEVLAQLSPLPTRINWWAWHPELPMNRELNVEVFVEDKGTDWGQWLAVGWPHSLQH